MPANAERYTAVAIVLHWAIAAAILINLAIGWWMHTAIDAPATQARAVAAFQIHKSIGLTVLVLSLIRLVWRLLHKPPPLPAAMPFWERFAAKATHWLFYALIIAIPLSGWLYVSTQWRGNVPLQVPTLWFGLFEVPHLFGLDNAGRDARQWLAGITFNAHWYLAWSTAGLLVLHIGAALKHQFIDRDRVLAHMVPALETSGEKAHSGSDRFRRITLRAGFATIALAMATITVLLLKPPGDVSSNAFTSAEQASQAITAAEGSWAIDPAHSQIQFSGVHAGSKFQGRFERWRVDIRINPDNISESHIAATINTASATDGNPLHDKTLPQQEWFDVEKYPVATYRATDIRQHEDDRHAVNGILTIKDNDIEVSGLILEIDGEHATLGGEFKIDREAANLGMESDPSGQWVSREIEVDVQASVSRRP